MLQRRLDRSALKLTALEHQVLRTLRDHSGACAYLAVAVSGGIDSIVLAKVVSRLRPLLKKPVLFLHVHHGLTGQKKTDRFRSQAQGLVKSLARTEKVVFKTNTPAQVKKRGLASEAALREYRYAKLFQLMKLYDQKLKGPGLLLVAQHWNDLLETRLIRLVRGVGPQGLKAMSVSGDSICRPFLRIEKNEIETYAQLMNLKWLDDPSNADDAPLRNWIRNDWLPSLEKKRPGAAKALAASLESLVLGLALGPVRHELQISTVTGFDRANYQRLSRVHKKQHLAGYLKALHVKNYTTNHIEELVKRLDTRKKVFRFPLLKLVWIVNAEHIRAQK